MENEPTFVDEILRKTVRTSHGLISMLLSDDNISVMNWNHSQDLLEKYYPIFLFFYIN